MAWSFRILVLHFLYGKGRERVHLVNHVLPSPVHPDARTVGSCALSVPSVFHPTVAIEPVHASTRKTRSTTIFLYKGTLVIPSCHWRQDSRFTRTGFPLRRGSGPVRSASAVRSRAAPRDLCAGLPPGGWKNCATEVLSYVYRLMPFCRDGLPVLQNHVQVSAILFLCVD